MDKHHPAPGHPLSRVRMIGDCDHGLWRGDTAAIESPGGVSIPCRGAQPAQTREYEGDQGDSIAVRVPGTPAVTRSPDELAADAAAGRTWLDYGILSGGARRLYGHELGARSWIYCAPDGSRWTATMGMGAAAQLAFRRFGAIPGAADAQAASRYRRAAVVPPAGRAGMRSFSALWMTYGATVRRRSSCRISLFDDERRVRHGYADWGLRWCYGVYRVGITGVPPAAVVTVTPMYAGSGLGRLSSTYSTVPETRGVFVYRDEYDATTMYYIRDVGEPVVPPPGAIQIDYWDMPAGVFTGEDAYIVGGCYVDDVATPVVLRKSYTITSTLEWVEVDGDPFTGIEYTEAYSASATIRLEIGSSSVGATAADAGEMIGYRSVDLFPPAPEPIGDGAMMLDGLQISARKSAGVADYLIGGTPAELTSSRDHADARGHPNRGAMSHQPRRARSERRRIFVGRRSRLGRAHAHRIRRPRRVGPDARAAPGHCVARGRHGVGELTPRDGRNCVVFRSPGVLGVIAMRNSFFCRVTRSCGIYRARTR